MPMTGAVVAAIDPFAAVQPSTGWARRRGWGARQTHRRRLRDAILVVEVTLAGRVRPRTTDGMLGRVEAPAGYLDIPDGGLYDGSDALGPDGNTPAFEVPIAARWENPARAGRSCWDETPPATP